MSNPHLRDLIANAKLTDIASLRDVSSGDYEHLGLAARKMILGCIKRFPELDRSIHTANRLPQKADTFLSRAAMFKLCGSPHFGAYERVYCVQEIA